MDNHPSRKVYYNEDLMYLIYQFDSTHIENHKKKFANCMILISSSAHTYWYNKYNNALYNTVSYDLDKILEYQDEFFDTLYVYLLDNDKDLIHSFQNIYV
jgi:hypothetical protein